MQINDLMSKYFIFRCRSFACNEIIPVYLSDNISSLYHYKEVDQNRTVDIKCPFCRHENHYKIADNIRIISKKEYDEAVKIAAAKISVRNLLNEAGLLNHNQNV